MSAKSTLREKAKKLPDAPGVYLFLNKKKEPIYIGKAGSLKKRAASYFLSDKHERTKEMLREASDITHETTDTVLEAFILEANLIKKHWPKYNVREKDNRSFVYLVIPKKEAFPSPMIVRGRELQKYGAGDADIFGPYQSYHLLKTALAIVRKVFPYCTKAQTKTSKTLRPCFYYQIGKCPGACIGAISNTEYKTIIKDLRLFFAGDKKRLVQRLKKQHPEKIRALEHIQGTALLSDSHVVDTALQDHGIQRIEGYDVSHLSGREPVGAMVVFEHGEKNTDEYRLFKIKGSSSDSPPPSVLPLPEGEVEGVGERGREGVQELPHLPSPARGGNRNRQAVNYSDTDMLKEVLTRRLTHKEWPYPDIIFVDGGRGQVSAMRSILREHDIAIPVVGLAKTGGHSASAHAQDKLIVSGAKKGTRQLIAHNKKLFQQVRNEAHRFAISFHKKRRRKR